MEIKSTIGLAAAVTVAMTALATGCGDGDADADPVDYFTALDASQAALDAKVDALFETPLAEEVNALLGDDLPDTLDTDQDALAREWMAAFWDGGVDAMEEHRDDVEDLDVPRDVRADHDAYVAAIDAFVGERDALVGRSESTPALELLQDFFEPPAQLEAFIDACEAMRVEASEAGVAFTSSICSE